METRSVLFGIVGLLIGGLIVSVAASLEAPKADHSDTHDMTMTQMTESLKDKTGDEYDKAFLEQMIAHHQSAVDMARLSAKNAKHDQIKTLSTNIITAQEKEITDMKGWQTKWGYHLHSTKD